MRKAHNVFDQLHVFEEEIHRLEGRLLELEQSIEKLIQIERNHLVRVKNKEELSDDFILSGRAYHDLSPERAWRIYQNMNYDFMVLDVSAEDFDPDDRIPEALQIPLDQLEQRHSEISSKTTPLLVISEDGTASVLACNFLVKRGYYNCNNVSGGYKFWKGSLVSQLTNPSA